MDDRGTDNWVGDGSDLDEAFRSLCAIDLSGSFSGYDDFASNSSEGHTMLEDLDESETDNETDSEIDEPNMHRKAMMNKRPITINSIPQEILTMIAERSINQDFRTKRLPLRGISLVQRRFARAGDDAIINFLKRAEATEPQYLTLPLRPTLTSFRKFGAILSNPHLSKYVQGIKMIPMYLSGEHQDASRSGNDLSHDMFNFMIRFPPRPSSLGSQEDSESDDELYGLPGTPYLLTALGKFRIKTLEFELPDPDESTPCYTSGRIERQRAAYFEELMNTHGHTVETLIINGWPVRTHMQFENSVTFSDNFKKLVFKFPCYNSFNDNLLGAIVDELFCLPEVDLGFVGFGDMDSPDAIDCLRIIRQLNPLRSPIGQTIKSLTLRQFVLRDWDGDVLMIDMPLLEHIYMDGGHIAGNTISNLVDHTMSSKPSIKSISLMDTRFDTLADNDQAQRALETFDGSVPNKYIMSHSAANSCACWSGHYRRGNPGRSSGGSPVHFEVKYVGKRDCPVHWVVDEDLEPSVDE